MRSQDQERNPLQTKGTVQQWTLSSSWRIEYRTNNTGREKEVFIELEKTENLFRRTNSMTGSKNTSFEKTFGRVINEPHDTPIKLDIESEKNDRQINANAEAVRECMVEDCQCYSYRFGTNPALVGKRKVSQKAIDALKNFRQKRLDDLSDSQISIS